MAPKQPKKKQQAADGLDEYRRKRSAERTPEPFQKGATEAPGLFVVQKHAARRMHYDLRLEIDGALHSWAVPKGPSFDPTDKRLAVQVEVHPLEYASFEGMIPEGNYGAGAVIVWDRGRWQPIGDPREGVKIGKLLFDLTGHKLRGRWTLFRTKGRTSKDNEWLLMKKPDGWANPATPPGEESVDSGRTVEELRDGVDPSARILARVKKLRAKRGRVPADSLEPQLAEVADEPFSKEGWVFELKYDGYRLLGYRENDDAVLRYRRGRRTTDLFPEIARALRALPHPDVVLDGEVVVLDEESRPSFQRLQRRVHLTRAPDIQRATVELPATWFVFDLLAYGGYDLRPLPLTQRKELLREVLPRAGPLRYSDHIEEQGEEMFEQVGRMGLEGLVAKRAEAPYRSGRSKHWLKIRADRYGDFAVVGYTRPKRSRSGFGALHLAGRGQNKGSLVYVGRVGSGFNDEQLDELRGILDAEVLPAAACEGALPVGDEHVWVAPRLVAEVRFKEWTGAGHLRHPVFQHLRADKSADDPDALDPAPGHEDETGESVRGDATAAAGAGAGAAVEDAPQPEPERRVVLSNRDKTFWPDEGYTKGDLLAYYEGIAPWILPYLRDRPLVLTRYPDGIRGKSFYQKDAPAFVPDWIRTEAMWSESTEREIRYFVCDDVESLLYVINLGAIPLHLWASRVGRLQQPDWCILDLDPKEAPFGNVIRIARAIRKLCDEIGLGCFVKTSGSTGLHVLLPLGGLCTFEQAKSLGQLMARIVVAQLPKIATIARSPAARGGRVYVDFLQNGHGKLLVSPFCVRPLPGAPVSTPLRWSEVRSGLDIRRYTIRSVPRRFRSMKRDPLLDVIETRPDLGAALENLASRL